MINGKATFNKNNIYKKVRNDKSWNPSRHNSATNTTSNRTSDSSSIHSFIIHKVPEKDNAIKLSCDKHKLRNKQVDLFSVNRESNSRNSFNDSKDIKEPIEIKIEDIMHKLISIKDILLNNDKKFETIKELNNETINNSFEFFSGGKSPNLFIPLDKKYKNDRLDEIRHKSQERISVYKNLLSEIKQQMTEISYIDQELHRKPDIGEKRLSRCGSEKKIQIDISIKTYNKKVKERTSIKNSNSSKIDLSRSYLNSSKVKTNETESGLKNQITNASANQKLNTNENINISSDLKKLKDKDGQIKGILRTKKGEIIKRPHSTINFIPKDIQNSQNSKLLQEKKENPLSNQSNYKNFDKTLNKNKSKVDESIKKRNKSVQEKQIIEDLLKDSFYEIKNEDEALISKLPESAYKSNYLNDFRNNPVKRRRVYSQNNLNLSVNCQKEEIMDMDITTINEEDLEECYILENSKRKMIEGQLSSIIIEGKRNSSKNEINKVISHLKKCDEKGSLLSYSQIAKDTINSNVIIN